MKSEYAKELTKADVWNTNLDEQTLKTFLDYRYYEKFLDERFNRTPETTDRESAIIFGLPKELIEGVLVGRQIEQDEEKLKYIKNKSIKIKFLTHIFTYNFRAFRSYGS